MPADAVAALRTLSPTEPERPAKRHRRTPERPTTHQEGLSSGRSESSRSKVHHR